MAYKKFWLGMLIFGLLLSSCDLNNDHNDNGYTLEFKIKNQRYLLGGTVTKVEFINGDTVDDPVLQTQNVIIADGEISDKFVVSGFNHMLDDNEIFPGVKLTYNDDAGDTEFGSTIWSKNNGGKILVRSSPGAAHFIDFLKGDW